MAKNTFLSDLINGDGYVRANSGGAFTFDPAPGGGGGGAYLPLTAGSSFPLTDSLWIKADNTNTIPNQLVIEGATSTNHNLIIGYHTDDINPSNGYGSIQAVYQDGGYTPLQLNPNGGSVSIGTIISNSDPYKLHVFGGDIGITNTDANINPNLQIINNTGFGFFISSWGSAVGGNRYGISQNDMALIESQSTTGPLVIGNHNSQPIIFGSNLIEIARFDTLGNLTANSFVRAGGLSTEYLMADGSVSTGSVGGVDITAVHLAGTETITGDKTITGQFSVTGHPLLARKTFAVSGYGAGIHTTTENTGNTSTPLFLLNAENTLGNKKTYAISGATLPDGSADVTYAQYLQDANGTIALTSDISTSLSGYLALTGGTLTGPLTMSGSSADFIRVNHGTWPATYLQGYWGSMHLGSNVFYNGTNFIYSQGTNYAFLVGADPIAGVFGISTAPQGASGTVATMTARMSMAPSGATVFSSSVTASSLIKAGGTSSQFLKADGSVDTNAYVVGSGTINQIPFFSASNTLSGSNNFTWDNTNRTMSFLLGLDGYIKYAQVGWNNGYIQTAYSNFLISSNLKYNGSSWLYDAAGYGSQVQVESYTGHISLSTATLGSAGGAANPIPRLKIVNDGRVLIGATLPTDDNNNALQINNGLRVTGANFDAYIDPVDANSLNFGWNTNAGVDAWINWHGYQGGSTQYRNLYIGDGKQGRIAIFSAISNGLTLGTVVGTGSHPLYAGNVSATGVTLNSYTVSTLPSVAEGTIVYVTDALAPSYNATLVGGGTVKTLALYNGITWTCH